jgi:hypothetical protein
MINIHPDSCPVVVDKQKYFKQGETMEDIMLVLGWGSPIGTGIFLLCLAGMIYLLTKATKKKD